MVDRLGSWWNSAAWRAPHLQSMHGRRKMRKIQTLITFFERIFAWGRQNHPDPHCRCHSHPQTLICLCSFPTLLVPRARQVACETADQQTTCSRPHGAACVRKKAFFLLERWIEQHPSLSKAKSLSAQSLSAAKAMCWLPALDIGGVTDRQVESLFVWLRAPWKLRGFTLPVDMRYIAGCMHSNNIASHRSTACGRGQVRRSLQSHTFLHASKFELKANQNEVFIATRDSRRLHSNFPLFYLQAASKADAFDAGDTLWRPSSSWVDFKTRSLLHFVANSRGLKLNYSHCMGIEVDLTLASPVFPNRTPCLPSQQTARGRPRIICSSFTIDGMATGRPRA